MNLAPETVIVLAGQIINSGVVICVVLYKFGYLTAIFKNFQPHRHIGRTIVYSDKFPPTDEQHVHGD